MSEERFGDSVSSVTSPSHSINCKGASPSLRLSFRQHSPSRLKPACQRTGTETEHFLVTGTSRLLAQTELDLALGPHCARGGTFAPSVWTPPSHRRHWLAAPPRQDWTPTSMSGSAPTVPFKSHPRSPRPRSHLLSSRALSSTRPWLSFRSFRRNVGPPALQTSVHFAPAPPRPWNWGRTIEGSQMFPE